MIEFTQKNRQHMFGKTPRIAWGAVWTFLHCTQSCAIVRNRGNKKCPGIVGCPERIYFRMLLGMGVGDEC